MCGIFGVVNRHKRQLDKRAFITLGCANDARGGDACGVMIDGKVDRGTEKDDVYFQNWYPKSKVLKDTEKCYVALGHCRKASVGGVAAGKAQPVTISDENGNLLFCLIHNGTIYNYEELAKKYIPGINIKNMTDSQVMAQIFFHSGYDVLKEYIGAGAFVIQDYRTNETFIFRGKSKNYKSSITTTEERPLYFVNTGKSIIFSSIFSVLQGLFWGFNAYDMPSNILLKCTGENLYKIKEYDRSECTQSKSSYTTTSKPRSGILSGYPDWHYNDYGYCAPKIDFDSGSGNYINGSTGEVLNGVVYVSDYGFISNYSTVYNKPYYFWKGIMLSGENAYRAMFDLLAQKLPEKTLLGISRRLSCNPVLINKKYYTFDADYKKIKFSEEYYYPLTDVVIYCDNGKLLADYCMDKIMKFNPVNLSVDTITKIINYVKSNIR